MLNQDLEQSYSSSHICLVYVCMITQGFRTQLIESRDAYELSQKVQFNALIKLRIVKVPEISTKSMSLKVKNKNTEIGKFKNKNHACNI